MKKKMIFRGAATALVTPFRSGRIDYACLGRLIDRQIERGIKAIVIGGTTGEAAVLSDRERYHLFSYSKERINGRARLILGTGTNDTRVAIRHTKFAEKLGCDGILTVTPYYNKGTESGVEKHYRSIANSTNLPMILYNVPSRTGVNLGFNLLERLATEENIVAIKEASDSIDRLVTLAGFGDDLTLYAGNDSQIYPTLALGGGGVISVASNLLPHKISGICENYFCGNFQESLSAQIEILPLVRALFLETNPAPIKYALSIHGLCREELRLPLASVRESTKASLREILAALT